MFYSSASSVVHLAAQYRKTALAVALLAGGTTFAVRTHPLNYGMPRRVENAGLVPVFQSKTMVDDETATMISAFKPLIKVPKPLVIIPVVKRHGLMGSCKIHPCSQVWTNMNKRESTHHLKGQDNEVRTSRISSHRANPTVKSERFKFTRASS